MRNGKAKLLTLFCPRSGEVRARGVIHTTNAVLHPWLQQELTAVLARLPQPLPVTNADQNHAVWQSWHQGLQVRITLPPVLPALRLLLVWHKLQGHWTPALIGWLFSHGVMPLYTSLGESWLNMAESMQRIVVRRALAGQYPQTPEQIIDALEATGWELGISEADVIKKVMLKETVDGEFTTVDDVAQTAAFLAGFLSNAINGQSIVVSHGWFRQYSRRMANQLCPDAGLTVSGPCWDVENLAPRHIKKRVQSALFFDQFNAK